MRIALLCLAGFVTASSSATSADPGLPRAIPVFRVQSNLAENFALHKQLETMWGNIDELSDLLEIASDLLGDEVPVHGRQAMYQFELFTTDDGYLAEIVFPAESGAARKTLKDAEAESFVTIDDYAVGLDVEFTGAEIENNDEQCKREYAQNVTAALRYVADHPTPDAVRCELLPSNLKSTRAHTRILAQLASAFTYAQRRDDEPASTHAIRAAGVQCLTDAATMCLGELDSFVLGLGRVAGTGDLRASVTARVRPKSRLHRVFDNLTRIHNRSLSYLHPDHNGFATITLPLPHKFAEALSQTDVHESIREQFGNSLPRFVIDPVCRIVDSINENQTLDILLQFLESSDAAPAMICIVPLRTGTANSIQQAGYTRISSQI